MKYKVFTSYFYQIRFFQKNMIPFSTAIWDPKWFHDNRDNKHIFVDKNGVINGLKAEKLQPPRDCDDCVVCQKSGNPFECNFIKQYEKKLNEIDFDDYISKMESFVEKLKIKNNMNEDPIIVLIVHEAPNNPCSERKTIQNLFLKHGIECEEWSKEAL